MRLREGRIGVCVFGAVMLLCVACQPANSPPLDVHQEANSPATTTGDIIVSMGTDGRVQWNGEEVSLEELRRRAKAIAGTSANLSVIIDGDPKYDQIRQVMELLEPSGLLKKGYLGGVPA